MVLLERDRFDYDCVEVSRGRRELRAQGMLLSFYGNESFKEGGEECGRGSGLLAGVQAGSRDEGWDQGEL
jgi:hypothetical protein